MLIFRSVGTNASSNVNMRLLVFTFFAVFSFFPLTHRWNMTEGIYLEPPRRTYETKSFDLFMPNVSIYKDNLYLCTSVKIPHGKTYYLVDFEPIITGESVNHAVVYGCENPGVSNKRVWNCGNPDEVDTADDVALACREVTTVVFAWDQPTPKFVLPPDVGFRAGRDSLIKYLVLQIHYSNPKNDTKDNSGLTVHYTDAQLSNHAGMLIVGTGGLIEQSVPVSMRAACKMEESSIIRPVAFRIQTDPVDIVVSAYRVRRQQDGLDSWTLIGRTQGLIRPQRFYMVDKQLSVKGTDTVAVSCRSAGNKTTVGLKEQMCNFYMMYSVEDEELHMKYCFSTGPPFYTFERHFNNVPASEKSEE